jgi:hypothetical protein
MMHNISLIKCNLNIITLKSKQINFNAIKFLLNLQSLSCQTLENYHHQCQTVQPLVKVLLKVLFLQLH